MSSKRNSAKTKTEILDATWDLVAEHGAGVTISEIAQSVGVSRQTVYLHFGTRGGLLMELVKRADERFAIFEDFAAAMHTDTPVDRLNNCVRVWLNFVATILPVARELIRLRATDEDAAAAWDDRMTDARKFFLKLTKSLHADDALSPTLTPAEAADYIWAATSVQVWDLLLTERRWKADRAVSVLAHSISAAILRSGSLR